MLALMLAAGCNTVFGIHEGTPRPLCVGSDNAAEPLIDDMEDGDGFICAANGRHGRWRTFSDGTSTDLKPAGEFNPTLIRDNKRGTSRYAARITGSGFSGYAGMGFDLRQEGLARQTYDASSVDGIKFWMKSTVPLQVHIHTPETFLPSSGGECKDSDRLFNCGRPFAFAITAPGADWREYHVPFSAFRQGNRGSATWNPRNLVGIAFMVPGAVPFDFMVRPAVAFDVWVDDIRFYSCGAGCVPTCADPKYPVPCPASGPAPGRCFPPGAECALGCNSSNTTAAPASGLITTFDRTGGGVDIARVAVEVPIGPVASAPTLTTDGALRISLNAPATSARQVFLVEIIFSRCIDATAFTGVQFSLSGSLSGCTLTQTTQDSAHLYPGSGGLPPRYGSGPRGAQPNGTLLTADQITSMPQTLMMPFATQSGGFPTTPIDRSKLTTLLWVFVVDPYVTGGATACRADLTIDDVRFYE